ncbi:Xylose operon regulatory protein [Rubripirellula obstinata]|uniref:Xylose operon regulatory protein n=2 Tax=Rubripirellula obstinata TaxID=406547 RepID=A0A5B1CLV3_9BACT|nr:Xylose operon regulatory protein [Rubripirellula obstinata]
MPHVLLLIESSRAYGRNCLMGIASFMRAHGPWHVLHLERGLQEDIPDVVKRQTFDGVIARIETQMIADSVRQFGVPTVDLRGAFIPDSGVALNTDSKACAEMAIEHFQQRGFRELAFCGYDGIDFSDERRDAFLRICKEKGVNARDYQPAGNSSEDSTGSRKPPQSPGISVGEPAGTLSSELGGELDDLELEQWLKDQPKPLGVFACNDMRGRQVLIAARRARLKVPDQVAVLGVDDDEVICDLANPPLTSIEPDAHRIGFEGATALAELMSGATPKQKRTLIPPSRLCVRMSTDVMAIEDTDLAAAVQYIRSNACDGIGVEDVLRATAYSRATLERRFRQILSRTPREEIERVRIDRVRMLLAETTYSLEQIAHMVSYKTSAHLVTAFRRTVDCTPGQYRRRFHGN